MVGHPDANARLGGGHYMVLIHVAISTEARFCAYFRDEPTTSIGIASAFVHCWQGRARVI